MMRSLWRGQPSHRTLYKIAAVVLTCVIVVMTLVSGAGAVSTAGADTDRDRTLGQQGDVDPDDVLITVSVAADGDATWAIEYRTKLSSTDREAAFTSLREDVEANRTAYTGRFRDRMERTVDAAATATGREMAVSNVSISAERRPLPQSYGVVTYQFTWSGFAAVDGDQLVAGDAIDGLFLDNETSLIVSWPDTHTLSTASPTPSETRNGSVVWVGPIDFTSGAPRVTTTRATGLPSTGALVLIAGVVLLFGAAAVVHYRHGHRRDTSDDTTMTGTAVDADGSEDGSGTVDGAKAGKAGGHPTDTDTGSVAERDTGDGADDEALLSNEERVLRLVKREGGRMKQGQVAAELNWTAAKTSQVVTGLRDDGRLEGFRLGRENVLSLPEEEDDEPEP
jgi:hypothetical protein